MRNWELWIINHHLSMTSLGRTPLESRGSRCHGFGRTLIWVWQSRHQVFVFQQFCVVPLDLTSPPDRHENVNINAILKIVNIFFANTNSTRTFTRSLLFIACEMSSSDAISLSGGLCLVSKDSSFRLRDWACARDLTTDIRTLKWNS